MARTAGYPRVIFSVTEIKALGTGPCRRLSVRLDGEYEGTAQAMGNQAGDPAPAVYTVHAVLPFSPEYGTLQIGQKFQLKAMEPEL